MAKKKFDYSPFKTPTEFRKMQQKSLSEFKARQKRQKAQYDRGIKALRHYRKTGKWPRWYK